MDVRAAVREVADKSTEKIKVVSLNEKGEFLQLMKDDSRSLMVLDWDQGEADILEILEYGRRLYRLETRPIFLIASTNTERLLAFAFEYHISRVYAGQVSAADISEGLLSLSAEEKSIGPLRALLDKITQQREAGDWEQSTVLLEDMHNKLSGQPTIAIELAENLIHANRWEEALGVIEPLKGLKPPLSRALSILSRCYLKLKRFDDAGDVLQNSTLLNPFVPDRLFMLGKILMGQEKYSEAREKFEAASDLDERFWEESKKAEGACLLLEGDLKDALSMLKGVSDLREKVGVFNTAAIIAIRKKNYEQGLDLYASALKLSRGNGELSAQVCFNRGIGYHRWKKNDEALDCFKEAVSFNPNYAKAKKYRKYLELKLEAGAEGKDEDDTMESLDDDSFFDIPGDGDFNL